MSRMSRPGTAVAAGLTLGTAAASLFLAPAAFAEDKLPAIQGSTTATVGTPFVVTGEGCTSPSEGPDAGKSSSVYVDVYTAAGYDDPEGMPVLSLPAAAPTAGAWTAALKFDATAPLGDYVIDVTCERYEGSEFPEFYDLFDFTLQAAGTTTAPVTTPTTTPTTTPAPSSTPAPAFKPGATPNTPGVASTTTDKTTGTAAAPGQKVVKVLKGFQPWENVTLVLHSDPVVLGTFQADANGVVTVEFTLPAGTPLAQHTLAYDGDKGTHFEEVLQVTADGKALAYTGTSIAMPLLGGSVLLAAGAGAMVIGRRRRTAGAAQA